MMFSSSALHLTLLFLYLQHADSSCSSYIMEQYNFTYSLSDILEETSAGSLLQCAIRCSYFNECVAVEQKDETSTCAVLNSVTEIAETTDTQQYKIKQQCPQTDTCGGKECSPLNVEHGKVTDNISTVGSEVHVDCDEGFMTTSGPNVSAVSICLPDKTFTPIHCFPVTCLKIAESPNKVTGAYKSYDTGSGHIVDIFCDYYPDSNNNSNIGYTFLSQTTLHHVTSLSNHYNLLDHVVIRHYRTGVDEQYSSELAVLSRYWDQYPNVSVFLSEHPDFPRLRYSQSTPYLYIGFVPVSFGSFTGTVQGYRCNRQNTEYTHCDGYPPDYFVVYQNVDGSVRRGSCCRSSAISRTWKTCSTAVTPSHNLPGTFFYDTYEILMGGCGGFVRSNEADVGGVIFGFLFNY